MDLRSLVPHSLAVLREASAELSEVLTCLGCDIVEKLDDDFVVRAVAALTLGGIVLHIDVTFAWSLIDAVFVGLMCHVMVDLIEFLIHIPELIQGPLHKSVASPEVGLTVENNDRRTFVLVKFTFKIVLQRF